LTKATEHFRVRIRKPGAFKGFHVKRLNELTEGAKAVIGRRSDGSKAVQSVEFDAVEWPDRGAARTWVKKNREFLEGLTGGESMDEIELGEDIFRPGSLTVDRDASIIRGAKLLGTSSENGYRYSPQALKDAARLYEGIKINIDHPDRRSPDTPRSVADRWGKATGVTVKEGDGVYGDVAFNPSHPLTESILWFAEHMPDALGFSQNGRGVLKPGGGGTKIVEAVRIVRHVDLVADAATTRSLFESKLGPLEATTTQAEDVDGDGGDNMEFGDLTLEQIRSKRPDLVTSLLQESKSTQASEKELTELQESNTALKKENDELNVSKALGVKKELVESVLAKSKLPKEAKTELFTETLMEAKDEEAMKALVEDRTKIVLNTKPKSKETDPLIEGVKGTQPSTGKEFASALKKR